MLIEYVYDILVRIKDLFELHILFLKKLSGGHCYSMIVYEGTYGSTVFAYD